MNTNLNGSFRTQYASASWVSAHTFGPGPTQVRIVYLNGTTQASVHCVWTVPVDAVHGETERKIREFLATLCNWMEVPC